ncbi:head GIN domain-containing protein [Arenibacter sp. GZD96]|uniref:head GIN domain-containing protein n=1 Tax=Aurantibrevibacter litoralis TaxID=3106030 RepID=UPI002AFE6675|nr:head GIN domain-containing protein [Arenibacter sp. GZD-96]MEA1784940.1 head GIN domain-containing protein [Arenibacter sp. GZD-96]
MKNSFLLGFTLLVITMANGQWGKKIKGNGNVVSIERNTLDYDEVSVAGWFNVELVEGKEGKITLKGEENLLEYIETEVKNGKLTIKVEKGATLQPSGWKNTVFVTVPVERIDAVSLSGSGDIVANKMLKANTFRTNVSGSGNVSLRVEAQTLSTTVSGSGDVQLSGRTEELSVSVSGSGDLKAFDLDADHVNVSISGSADVRITSNKSLKAHVSGSGNITYRGNPERLESKSSGSGKISKG